MLSNQNDMPVSLMLFYCLKVYIEEEEMKHWQNFVYYFLDGLLQTLSHIRIRLIRSTIPDKIFGTKWSNLVKLDKRRKVWYLFLRVFLTAISKSKFLNGD